MAMKHSLSPFICPLGRTSASSNRIVGVAMPAGSPCYPVIVFTAIGQTSSYSFDWDVACCPLKQGSDQNKWPDLLLYRLISEDTYKQMSRDYPIPVERHRLCLFVNLLDSLETVMYF